MNIMLPDEFVALVLSQFVASGLHYFVGQTLGATSHVFSRYLTTSIEIHVPYGGGSNVTSWLKQFIWHKCEEKLGHFRITNNLNGKRFRDRSDGYAGGKKSSQKVNNIKREFEPVPTDCSVFFWHKRTLIRVIRNVDPTLLFCGEYSVEILTITAFGTRNKQLLMDMIEEARKMAEKKSADKFVNYFRASCKHDYPRWTKICQVQPRALSSVILGEGVTEAIQGDVENFLSSRQWYKERGIPYRRGYLLYGPPGNGKTSFVKAIAGQLGFDIYEMQLSNRELSDLFLNTLMSRIGKKSILLLEDVDAAFMARPQDEEKAHESDVVSGKLKIREMKSAVTFSGLLNAIDGVASEEDYIVFMTTNHVDKLDAALIRPGRIDLKQFIDYPDEKQIAAFFKIFYPDCNEELPAKFAKATRDLTNPSIAQIQGIFLKHKKEPEDNLLDVESLVEICKENANTSHPNLYI